MLPRQNQSMANEFFIMGFQSLHSTRMLLFTSLLVIYMVTIAGNLLIIMLVSSTHHLYSPMYFFLSQLSLSDIALTTTITPSTLNIILKEGVTVSLAACIIQLYTFSASLITECLLLTVMSYDRYVAICKPMHYSNTMNFSFCLQLATLCWALGFALTFIVAMLISNLYFCGPSVINHFFCDYAPLVQLSCSDTYILETVVLIIATPETIIETVFILSTYAYIGLAIRRISSTTGRQKAFSTCSSHLAVVCICFGSIIATYVSPSGKQPLDMNKILSLLYTVVTPLLNPVIYSLKSQEIRTTISKRMYRLRHILN
ncbi:olfactory receptor 11L1-like [Mixophyes fleayi]|uniref:olfactory receptor 11L1-like n=1 Tax=Mixophyes fleayi TaxID=3061075 RepID=UPI003F4DF31D